MAEDDRVTEVNVPEYGCVFDAPTPAVAGLLAGAMGYTVDIEPWEPGRVKLTATHAKTGAVIRTNGSSPAEAAGKLINLLATEAKQ